MYRKKSRGWYKHKDFILIDLACLFMALILAYLIRNGSVRNLFTLGIYCNVMIFVILVDLFLIILFESYKGVLRRGRYQELRSVIRQMILIELASGLYLFTVSGEHTFSRIILYLMGIFYVLLSYCTRIIWKKRLLHKMAEGGEHSLYIVTNYDLASKVIQNVKEHNYNRYNINGLILIDKDMTGKEIAGVPVVADLNNASSFICQQWVDEVFVNVDETYPYPQELIEELLEMGMPVHVNLAKVRSTPGQKQFVEAIGGYTVLTTTMNYATDRQALAKRVLDILGGLVGCFLTGIIFIFIAPAIYISSPGPIFFSQTRIGKNGKPFKMYSGIYRMRTLIVTIGSMIKNPLGVGYDKVNTMINGYASDGDGGAGAVLFCTGAALGILTMLVIVFWTLYPVFKSRLIKMPAKLLFAFLFFNTALAQSEEIYATIIVVPIFLYVMLWNSQEVVKEDDMGHNVLKSKLQKIGKIE